MAENAKVEKVALSFARCPGAPSCGHLARVVTFARGMRERQRRLDLWAQTAGLDQLPNLVQLLLIDLGVERLPFHATP